MKTKTLLLALAAPICFGTGLTLAKPAVTHFPPLFMMLLAYSTVAIIMLLTVR
jgi:drug/metabolite transporter (DMT)-like permease